MNELQVYKNNDGAPALDSREVAQMVDKQHKELLRDIRNYEVALTSADLRPLDFFIPHTYLDGKGESRPCYLVTRKGCDMVANKLTGEKGVIFTARYINRFHEMEQTQALPRTLPEALRLAADLAEQREALTLEVARKDQIIGELQPKADYTDYILSSTGTVTTTQIAADYGMSARRLNKILHEERIQRFVGDQWVLYSEHMGKGYTKSETINIERSDGRPDTKMFTRWTQKGRLMINEALNRRGIYANMDLIKTA